MSSTFLASHRVWSAVLLVSLACSGCFSQTTKAPVREFNEVTPTMGEQALDAGVADYDNGEYKAAARNLQSALELGLEPKKQATAYKYLAFIECASGRRLTCKDQFRKAFDADSAFELKPAEAGHPMWGPVYRNVKAEVASGGRQR